MVAVPQETAEAERLRCKLYCDSGRKTGKNPPILTASNSSAEGHFGQKGEKKGPSRWGPHDPEQKTQD